MAQSKRYTLATLDRGKRVLLSPSCAKIVKALSAADSTYADLIKRAKVDKASVYIFVGRLVRAGVVSKKTCGDRTVLLSLKSFVALESISVIG